MGCGLLLMTQLPVRWPQLRRRNSECAALPFAHTMQSRLRLHWRLLLPTLCLLSVSSLIHSVSRCCCAALAAGGRRSGLGSAHSNAMLKVRARSAVPLIVGRQRRSCCVPSYAQWRGRCSYAVLLLLSVAVLTAMRSLQLLPCSSSESVGGGRCPDGSVASAASADSMFHRTLWSRCLTADCSVTGRTAVSGLRRSGSASARRRVLQIESGIDPAGNGKSCRVPEANTGLARLLAREHAVSVLVLCPAAAHAETPAASTAERVDDFGVRWLRLPAGHRVYDPAYPEMVSSYEALLWLIEHAASFDVVHFDSWRGLGYYTNLALQQGHPALQQLSVVTICQRTTLHSAMAQGEMLSSVAELGVDFMERQSLLYSQHVVSPTQHMLDWMTAHQYSFPHAQTLAVMPLPLLLPAAVVAHQQQSPATPARSRIAVQEVVFVGSLQDDGRLQLILQAAQLLSERAAQHVPGYRLPRLTLLAEVTPRTRAEVVMALQRVAQRPDWVVRTNLSAQDAVAFLLERGQVRLACIMEGSSEWIQAALTSAIPFLTVDAGGAAELIAAADRSRVTFPPLDAQSLAMRLEEAVRSGYQQPQLSFDTVDNARQWLHWHATVQRSARASAAVSPDSAAQPVVSVIMATYNRTAHVLEALASLREQSYERLEVVVVDDGSQAEAALHYQEQVAAFVQAQRGWRLIRSSHAGESQARNEGALLARGEYLLFMDDDNLAKQHEVATFMRAWQHASVDILTCMLDFLPAEQPNATALPSTRWLLLGPSPGVNLYSNVVGDANFMIRRGLFLELGGFPDSGVAEDLELLVLAVMRGYQVQVIPDALYWKRTTELTRAHATQVRQAAGRLSPAYLSYLPHDIGLALLVGRQALEKQTAAVAEMAARVASTAPDFGLKQGYKGWYYSWKRPGGALQPLTAAASEWRLSDTYCFIRQHSQHPCVNNGEAVAVMRSWRADFDGSVILHITAGLLRVCGGDGTRLLVEKGNSTLLSAVLVSPGRVSYPALEVSVSYGDLLQIVVHPAENEGCDETDITATISNKPHTH